MSIEQPDHITQLCHELIESTHVDSDRRRASSFSFKGHVPRIGERISRAGHQFEVTDVLWEMGRQGTTIHSWARVFLK
jgi:hypothetical protein